MTDRMKGTLAGIGFSLIAVVIWVILGYVLGLLAGLAGALMGVFFILGYNKFNVKDQSKYPIIVACILIIILIIISEFIVIAFVCADYGISMSEALQLEGVSSVIALDIILGAVLSYVVFFIYIYTSKNKNKEKLQRSTVSTDIDSKPDDNNSEGPKQL